VVVVTVDHNRAVAPPAAKGEFIDPENLGRLNRWFGQCPDQSQQRHAAGRLLLASAQSAARPTTQHQRDRFKIAPQTPRAPSVAVNQQWHLLGEGAPRVVDLFEAPVGEPDVVVRGLLRDSVPDAG
jgi:hypothetical protein